MATILMAAGEGLPFIKSGGLADVIGSLAPELVKKGHEVRVVMPLYKKDRGKSIIRTSILKRNTQYPSTIMKCR